MTSQTYELSPALTIIIFVALVFLALIFLVIGVKVMLTLNSFAEQFWKWISSKELKQEGKHEGQLKGD